MRPLGYGLSILGFLILITANLNFATQLVETLLNFLGTIAQFVLQYVSSQGLTIGGLVVIVLGLLLILLSYRR